MLGYGRDVASAVAEGPMILLVAGLGGDSQDSYVRSMAGYLTMVRTGGWNEPDVPSCGLPKPA